MEPELIIKNQPIDIELCKLLNHTPSDFLVLCLDGVALEGYGTPHATPSNRADWQKFVERLNDRSGASWWPDMWRNWKRAIRKQFALPETTTSVDYRPVVSYKISRVCVGYSEYLPAAIGLFETLADKFETWSVSNDAGLCEVSVTDKCRRTFINTGSKLSLLIVQTVLQLLMANRENKDLQSTPAGM